LLFFLPFVTYSTAKSKLGRPYQYAAANTKSANHEQTILNFNLTLPTPPFLARIVQDFAKQDFFHAACIVS
jgi:hypothetical protein